LKIKLTIIILIKLNLLCNKVIKIIKKVFICLTSVLSAHEAHMFDDPLHKNIIRPLPQEAVPFDSSKARGVYTEPFPSSRTRRAESTSILRERGFTAEEALTQHQQKYPKHVLNPSNNSKTPVTSKLQQRIYSVLTLTSLCPIPSGESALNMDYQALLSSETAFGLHSIQARIEKFKEDEYRLKCSRHSIKSRLNIIAEESKRLETIQNIICNKLSSVSKKQETPLNKEYQDILEKLRSLDTQKSLFEKRLKLVSRGLKTVTSQLNKVKELTQLFQEETEQLFQNSFSAMQKTIPWYEGKKNLLQKALNEKKRVSLNEKKERDLLCEHFLREVELITQKRSTTPKRLFSQTTFQANITNSPVKPPQKTIIDPEVEAELKAIAENAQNAAKKKDRERLKRL
jgi:hypothetical protein